jgi:hypothetical protein
MHATRHVLTIVSLIGTAVALSACQSSPALEEMAPGTDLTIELQDGRRVTGKLVNVDAETVVVDQDRTEGRIAVTRSGIAAAAPSAEAPRKPELREVTLPAGSTFEARLDTAVASNSNAIEDPVQATLTAPLIADGVTVAPVGSRLLGTVTTARESGRVRGRAEIGVRFDRLQTNAVTYDIDTAPMRWTADATKSEDAKKIGIGAAAGAIVGAIAGGGKGAAVGSAVGAGGGSAVVLATRGEEILLESGTKLNVELTGPFSVVAPAGTN